MDNFFIKRYKALKNRDFLKLLVSQFLSQSGGYIQNVALSAFITSESDKRLKLGIFLFISYLPVCLFSYFTAKLTSKISPLKILVCTEILLFIMSGVLFVFHDMGFYMLLVFGAVWGTVRAFQTPAASSMPKLLCTDDELLSGVGAISLSMSLSRAIGPIVSGVIYAAWGFRASFLANALSYIPSLFLLFKIKPIKPTPKTHGKVKLNPFLLIIVFVVSMTGTAYNIVFTGITQKLGLSKLWFSIFMALVGLGSVIGACVLTKNRRALFASLGISALCALLALSKSLFVICPVIVLYGLCDYLFFTSAMRTIQVENDRSSVSRAMGIYTVITTGALPLGFLVLGFLTDSFGVQSVLWTSSAAIGSIYLLFFRKTR